jgi:lysophospholipase L1-like esterase
MMFKLLLKLVLITVLCAFSFPQQKKIRIFLAGDSTISIKDPKNYPETGWGMPFVHFWDSTVSVVNLAKNGRSTRTFISEGLWKTIYSDMEPGDYVFIQFGHNDEVPSKVSSYTKPDEFKSNLKRFIKETLDKGGVPVLLTPVSRRNFKEGKQVETHTEYSAYVREVAKERDVALIDLDEKSRELYQQLGEESSRLLFLHLKAGEHPNYPEGKTDNTHFSELGARLVAQLVLKEIQALKLGLDSRIVIRKR